MGEAEADEVSSAAVAAVVTMAVVMLATVLNFTNCYWDSPEGIYHCWLHRSLVHPPHCSAVLLGLV